MIDNLAGLNEKDKTSDTHERNPEKLLQKFTVLMIFTNYTQELSKYMK